MAIQKSCIQILNSVRNSNLNFSCQETPFSLYLTVRKSWNKKYCKSEHKGVDPNLEMILSENNLLKAELADVKAQLNISKDNTSEFETKIAAAESEVLKVYKETKSLKLVFAKKDDEIVALKTSIKNSTTQMEQTGLELLNLKKMLKSKDKEIYNLENYKINHQETVKALKENVRDIKKVNKALEKQAKNAEKKVVDLQKKKYAEANNNKPVLPSPSTASVPVPSDLSIPSTPFISLVSPSEEKVIPQNIPLTSVQHSSFSTSQPTKDNSLTSSCGSPPPVALSCPPRPPTETTLEKALRSIVEQMETQTEEIIKNILGKPEFEESDQNESN